MTLSLPLSHYYWLNPLFWSGKNIEHPQKMYSGFGPGKSHDLGDKWVKLAAGTRCCIRDKRVLLLYVSSMLHLKTGTDGDWMVNCNSRTRQRMWVIKSVQTHIIIHWNWSRAKVAHDQLQGCHRDLFQAEGEHRHISLKVYSHWKFFENYEVIHLLFLNLQNGAIVIPTSWNWKMKSN